MDADADREALALQMILARLGQEICSPLDRLRGGIDRLLADPSHSLSELERPQAEMMRRLCEDLERLTRESLGTP